MSQHSQLRRRTWPAPLSTAGAALWLAACVPAAGPELTIEGLPDTLMARLDDQDPLVDGLQWQLRVRIVGSETTTPEIRVSVSPAETWVHGYADGRGIAFIPITLPITEPPRASTIVVRSPDAPSAFASAIVNALPAPTEPDVTEPVTPPTGCAFDHPSLGAVFPVGDLDVVVRCSTASTSPQVRELVSSGVVVVREDSDTEAGASFLHLIPVAARARDKGQAPGEGVAERRIHIATVGDVRLRAFLIDDAQLLPAQASAEVSVTGVIAAP